MFVPEMRDKVDGGGGGGERDVRRGPDGGARESEGMGRRRSERVTYAPDRREGRGRAAEWGGFSV